MQWSPHILFVNQYTLNTNPHSQELQTFPTRRSSDLHGVGRVHRDVVSFLSQQLDSHILAVSEQYRRIVSLIQRSEEHTSELQSRGHLLCRLLLEKKEYIVTDISLDSLIEEYTIDFVH